MAEGTYGNLVSYTGSRYSNNAGVEQVCNQLDDMKCADLAWVGVALSSHRAEQVTGPEIIQGNRLHEPSGVSQRDFNTLEGVIMDEIADMDLVELSPVQPYIDLLMKKDHLKTLDKKQQRAARERCEHFMSLFNANLQYAGYSVMLYQKRAVADETEFFLSESV